MFDTEASFRTVVDFRNSTFSGVSEAVLISNIKVTIIDNKNKKF